MDRIVEANKRDLGFFDVIPFKEYPISDFDELGYFKSTLSKICKKRVGFKERIKS